MVRYVQQTLIGEGEDVRGYVGVVTFELLDFLSDGESSCESPKSQHLSNFNIDKTTHWFIENTIKDFCDGSALYTSYEKCLLSERMKTKLRNKNCLCCRN